VIGIVASKILDRHYRPVILFTLSQRKEDLQSHTHELGRVFAGSARSIAEIDLYSLLKRASDLMISFGGHSMAAGIKIHEKNIPALRQRLNEIVEEKCGTNHFHRALALDSTLRLNQINLDFLQQTRIMEPCGVGNPRPVFCSEGVNVLEAHPCGADRKHLKMRVGQAGTVMDAIGFGLAHVWNLAELRGGTIDISYTLKEDNFRSRRSVALQVCDLRSSI
jgi:single-stranded-DNA-specific exonuclease